MNQNTVIVFANKSQDYLATLSADDRQALLEVMYGDKYGWLSKAKVEQFVHGTYTPAYQN